MIKADSKLPQLPERIGSLGASARGSWRVQEPVSTPETDDLAREVYGVLGMPIDALDRTSVLQKIVNAVEVGRPFLLSTPNVNFLTASQRDADFRESLMQSDLCPADGMPIVWISRLLGMPIKERVSGSDLFETIRSHGSPSQPVKVFLLGGAAGVAETVCGILNSQPTGIRCVGWLNPGFGTVEEMSGEDVINKINSSNADLLAIFFSAKKAQAWLLRNHDRLGVPVRGQFGATINYQAGTVRRAPRAVQRMGFEWLWRIKEEPYLWRRYRADGLSLINLVIFRALPIAIGLWRSRSFSGGKSNELLLRKREHHGSLTVSLVGHATEPHAAGSIACFREALAENRSVVIDVSQTRSIDPRYFGLLLMLRKQLRNSGQSLTFTGASKRMYRLFHLNGFAFLLNPESEQRSTAIGAS
jgi:N-acetylglucosaminyldiphosphoundecaprenol N-acetyl-beta-D-mannosaminyltransferase